MKARDAISEAASDGLDDRLDRAINDLDSFDSFSTDELRRFVVYGIYAEGDSSDFDYLKHLKHASREDAIGDIIFNEYTPQDAAEWIKGAIRQKEVERIYDVYTSLAPDVDVDLMSSWIPNIKMHLRKDVLKSTKKELIAAMEKAGYFGSKSDSARHDSDKYF